jgi:hypothetical protein
MKHLFFRAFIKLEDWKILGITKGDNLFLCRYENDWKQIVQRWLREITEADKKRIESGKSACELEIFIKPHYADRTIKENNLMWKIYDIQAKILNNEMKNVRNPVITSELYNEDMKDYAPVHAKECSVDDELAIISFAENGEAEYKGHFINKEIINNNRVVLHFRETSSFWDKMKFSEFLDYKINELEQMGIDRWNDGEVKALIIDFRKNLKEANNVNDKNCKRTMGTWGKNDR